MQKTNPLRISQELLDIDDIISDLNSDVVVSQNPDLPKMTSTSVKSTNAPTK
jgi:hypothetical protein